MKTNFQYALGFAGLCNRTEAAEYLKVSKHTIDSWCSGKRNPPPGVWDALVEAQEDTETFADAISPGVEPGTMTPEELNNFEVDEKHGGKATAAFVILDALRDTKEERDWWDSE